MGIDLHILMLDVADELGPRVERVADGFAQQALRQHLRSDRVSRLLDPRQHHLRFGGPDRLAPPQTGLRLSRCVPTGPLQIAKILPSIRLASPTQRAYCNHTIKTTELTVTRVGNSRGVRLPAQVLRGYRVGETLIMEQRPDEIVLRPKRTRRQKLNWADTYQQMAQTNEDWSDWESLPEGLTAMPGEAGR